MLYLAEFKGGGAAPGLSGRAAAAAVRAFSTPGRTGPFFKRAGQTPPKSAPPPPIGATGFFT
ncbi:MAG: hypothetical protein DBY09_02430 [Selenomonadales bacterium]|nr:MAG: hypothetical protein DBY09_02430 [Selenomonadales bacterium]